MSRKTSALLTLACLPLLQACGESRLLPTLETRRLEVPESLLTCAPAPGPRPLGDQEAVALLILDLAEAGEDCRAKLAAVRGVVSPINSR